MFGHHSTTCYPFSFLTSCNSLAFLFFPVFGPFLGSSCILICSPSLSIISSTNQHNFCPEPYKLYAPPIPLQTSQKHYRLLPSFFFIFQMKMSRMYPIAISFFEDVENAFRYLNLTLHSSLVLTASLFNFVGRAISKPYTFQQTTCI